MARSPTGSVLPVRPKGELGSLRVLWPFLYPYRLRVVLASACLIIAALLVLALVQGVRRLIDFGFHDTTGHRLDQAAVVMIGIVVSLAVATAGRFYLVSWLGERVSADLRGAVFGRVVDLSPEFFETARTGEILTRLTADTTLIQTVIGSVISQWLRSALMLMGAMVMLVVASPKLAVIVLLLIPAVVGPLIVFGRRERKLSREAQNRIADLGAFAEETLNAIRTVQAFTHEFRDRSRFGDLVNLSLQAALARIATRARLLLLVIMLTFSAITGVLWVGGREVLSGQMSPGVLSGFVIYAVIIATSGATLSELWGDVQRAAGAAERLAELLVESPDIAPPAVPALLPNPPLGTLALDHVSFSYPSRPDLPAVSDLSFSVASGETLALVGPSGAGKSTIFQLLMRFYDPAQGSIALDGVKLVDLDPQVIRQRIGVVSQEPVLFAGSVTDNIRYGRPEATTVEIHAAADAAFALEFIERLPDGFGCFLGEKGVRLSGGQRQRIAIARAILRDPAILLLDEATSSLDAESERLVQRALERLAHGRTTLVIAHRLATVRSADRILVIDQGRIVGSGTHDQLVAEGGLYARLAALQFKAA
jgi:ATP-binding cassette subfamily B protein